MKADNLETKNIIKNKNLFLLLCLALFFYSCALGPDYKRAELELPTDYVNTKKIPAENDKFNAYWWESFNDPVLTKLIIEATNSNLDLKQAFQRLSLTRANARSAFQDLFPQVNIFGSYQKSRSPALRFPGSSAQAFSFQIFSLGLDASWELDIFGKLKRLSESQGELSNQQLYLTAGTVGIIQAEVATNYIQYRLAQAQGKIAEQNFKKQKVILNLLKQKLEFGDISLLDYERTNSLSSNTEALIPQFQSTQKAALYRLATLLGLYINNIPSELLDQSNIPNYKGPRVIGNPSDVVKRRPDVLAAESFAKAENAQIGASIANLFPQLSFTGSLSEDGRKANDLFTTDASAYTLAPRIIWPIINIGSIIQDIKASKARARESILAYKQTILNALEEIEITLVQLDNEIQRKISLENAHKSASKVAELANEQYVEGLIDNLELIQSQQAALESESLLRESEANLALSYIKLFKALGSGWEEEKEIKK